MLLKLNAILITFGNNWLFGTLSLNFMSEGHVVFQHARNTEHPQVIIIN